MISHDDWYALCNERDALAARLADESREHADTLCHNAEMGAALVDCRARLAEAERLLRSLRGHIPSETGWGQDQLDEVDAFLRPADSAAEQESDDAR